MEMEPIRPFSSPLGKRRLRDRELLVERDVLMAVKRVEGRSDKEIARLFNISRQLVNRRLLVFPEPAWAFIRKVVATHLDRSGLCLIPGSTIQRAVTMVRKSDGR